MEMQVLARQAGRWLTHAVEAYWQGKLIGLN